MSSLQRTLRGLWRNRRLTMVVVLCLAIGIGTNVTIFSVCEALLLRPLPGTSRSDRLVTLIPRKVRVPGLSAEVRSSLSIDDLRRLQQGSRAFSFLAAAQTLPLSLAAGDLASRVSGQLVSPDFFKTLGTGCTLGRCLSDAADLQGRQVAVLGDALWRSQFGGRRDAVGRIIRLNGEPFEVIGVAPPGFRGAQREERPDAWLPLLAAPAVLPALHEGRFESKRWIPSLVGRLAPGISASLAQQDVDRVFQAVAAGGGDSASLQVYEGLGIEPDTRSRVLRPLTLLFAFGGILLLTIWANVAGLLLGQTVARMDELGMRQALGAPRARLARQLFGEYLLLALCGGAAGSGLCVAALNFLEGTSLGEALPTLQDLQLDGQVIAVAFALSLLSAVVVSVVPVGYSTRRDLASMLRARTTSGTSPRQLRLYDLFVVGQIAASMALLIATALLVQSFRNLVALNLGFSTSGVVHCRIDLAPQQPAAAAGRDIFAQLLDRALHLRGVRAAALARSLPFESRHAARGLLEVAPEDAGPAPTAGRYLAYDAVSPGYFQALGIPLLYGRDFSAAGAGVEPSPVVVVDEAMAKAFWPNAQALGRRLIVGGKPHEVIGIVTQVRQDGRGDSPPPYFYIPLDYAPAQTLVLRIDGTSGPILGAVRSELGRLAPLAPIFDVGRMQDDVEAGLAQPHMLARFFSAYTASALLLAAMGLYGALMHLVRIQRRELGIRMALGARREALLTRVLRRGLLLTTAGLCVGVALATALGRLLQGLLYGVGPSDPFVIVITSAVLIVIGLCSSALPAIAAMRLDPAATIRSE